jgi:hypothetical protein
MALWCLTAALSVSLSYAQLNPACAGAIVLPANKFADPQGPAIWMSGIWMELYTFNGLTATMPWPAEGEQRGTKLRLTMCRSCLSTPLEPDNIHQAKVCVLVCVRTGVLLPG